MTLAAWALIFWMDGYSSGAPAVAYFASEILCEGARTKIAEAQKHQLVDGAWSVCVPTGIGDTPESSDG